MDETVAESAERAAQTLRKEGYRVLSVENGTVTIDMSPRPSARFTVRCGPQVPHEAPPMTTEEQREVNEHIARSLVIVQERKAREHAAWVEREVEHAKNATFLERLGSIDWRLSCPEPPMPPRTPRR